MKLQRRMAMSRRMLQRPLPERRESDEDRADRLESERILRTTPDADWIPHAQLKASLGVPGPLEDTLISRALEYVDQRIRIAQQELMVKRQELQAAWMRMEALESERRQILDEQAAAAEGRRDK